MGTPLRPVDVSTPRRAAVYLRISDDPTGLEAGVTRQREDCLELVAAQGWQVHDVYVDNDLSAYSGKPRPNFRRLLADIAAGNIDSVVAWHPDRLYRRPDDLEQLIDSAEANNAIMRTVRAGEIDLSTPTGRMLARMLAAHARAEGEIKADRWKRAWRQGREQGQPARTGSRLFGYTRGGEIVDASHVGCKALWRKAAQGRPAVPCCSSIDEAAVARGMAADILAGIPILTIARRLEAEKVLTTRGTLWRPGTVRQYLVNPRIAGWSTLHGEIVAEGTWAALLDRDTWETVRALLASRARAYAPRVSLLNGLLFCGAPGCGHRMITSGQRGKRTYRCPNRPGMPGCGGVSGNAEPIEEIVEAYTQARLADPKILAAIHARATRGNPKALAEIATLEARIAELEQQLDQPGTPVNMIVRAIDRARTRLEETQRHLVAAPPSALPTSAGDWPEDLERRRRLVDLVVARVDLAPATRRVRPFDVDRVKITDR